MSFVTLLLPLRVLVAFQKDLPYPPLCGLSYRVPDQPLYFCLLWGADAKLSLLIGAGLSISNGAVRDLR
jgi:hypothetical protein